MSAPSDVVRANLGDPGSEAVVIRRERERESGDIVLIKSRNLPHARVTRIVREMAPRSFARSDRNASVFPPPSIIIKTLPLGTV